jgi:hypothetical protein
MIIIGGCGRSLSHVVVWKEFRSKISLVVQQTGGFPVSDWDGRMKELVNLFFFGPGIGMNTIYGASYSGWGQ